MGETEPVTERWTFGGNRVGKGDKRIHEWITPDGTSLWYKASGSPAVGCEYDVRVVRGDGKVTRHGNPIYVGRSNDDKLRDSLSVQHRAAELSLGLVARERRDKAEDPLEQAIERLAELAMNIPASQRAGLAVYVVYKMGKAW